MPKIFDENGREITLAINPNSSNLLGQPDIIETPSNTRNSLSVTDIRNMSGGRQEQGDGWETAPTESIYKGEAVEAEDGKYSFGRELVRTIPRMAARVGETALGVGEELAALPEQIAGAFGYEPVEPIKKVLGGTKEAFASGQKFLEESMTGKKEDTALGKLLSRDVDFEKKDPGYANTILGAIEGVSDVAAAAGAAAVTKNPMWLTRALPTALGLAGHRRRTKQGMSAGMEEGEASLSALPGTGVEVAAMTYMPKFTHAVIPGIVKAFPNTQRFFNSVLIDSIAKAGDSSLNKVANQIVAKTIVDGVYMHGQSSATELIDRFMKVSNDPNAKPEDVLKDIVFNPAALGHSLLTGGIFSLWHQVGESTARKAVRKMHETVWNPETPWKDRLVAAYTESQALAETLGPKRAADYLKKVHEILKESKGRTIPVDPTMTIEDFVKRDTASFIDKESARDLSSNKVVNETEQAEMAAKNEAWVDSLFDQEDMAKKSAEIISRNKELYDTFIPPAKPAEAVPTTLTGKAREATIPTGQLPLREVVPTIGTKDTAAMTVVPSKSADGKDILSITTKEGRNTGWAVEQTEDGFSAYKVSDPTKRTAGLGYDSVETAIEKARPLINRDIKAGEVGSTLLDSAPMKELPADRPQVQTAVPIDEKQMPIQFPLTGTDKVRRESMNNIRTIMEDPAMSPSEKLKLVKEAHKSMGKEVGAEETNKQILDIINDQTIGDIEKQTKIDALLAGGKKTATKEMNTSSKVEAPVQAVSPEVKTVEKPATTAKPVTTAKPATVTERPGGVSKPETPPRSDKVPVPPTGKQTTPDTSGAAVEKAKPLADQMKELGIIPTLSRVDPEWGSRQGRTLLNTISTEHPEILDKVKADGLKVKEAKDLVIEKTKAAQEAKGEGKDKAGVSDKVGVGEKPVEAKPVVEPSKPETKGSGDVQAPKEEKGVEEAAKSAEEIALEDAIDKALSQESKKLSSKDKDTKINTGARPDQHIAPIKDKEGKDVDSVTVTIHREGHAVGSAVPSGYPIRMTRYQKTTGLREIIDEQGSPNTVKETYPTATMDAPTISHNTPLIETVMSDMANGSSKTLSIPEVIYNTRDSVIKKYIQTGNKKNDNAFLRYVETKDGRVVLEKITGKDGVILGDKYSKYLAEEATELQKNFATYDEMVEAIQQEELGRQSRVARRAEEADANIEELNSLRFVDGKDVPDGVRKGLRGNVSSSDITSTYFRNRAALINLLKNKGRADEVAKQQAMDIMKDIGKQEYDKLPEDVTPIELRDALGLKNTLILTSENADRAVGFEVLRSAIFKDKLGDYTYEKILYGYKGGDGDSVDIIIAKRKGEDAADILIDLSDSGRGYVKINSKPIIADNSNKDNPYYIPYYEQRKTSNVKGDGQTSITRIIENLGKDKKLLRDVSYKLRSRMLPEELEAIDNAYISKKLKEVYGMSPEELSYQLVKTETEGVAGVGKVDLPAEKDAITFFTTQEGRDSISKITKVNVSPKDSVTQNRIDALLKEKAAIDSELRSIKDSSKSYGATDADVKISNSEISTKHMQLKLAAKRLSDEVSASNKRLSKMEDELAYDDPALVAARDKHKALVAESAKTREEFDRLNIRISEGILNRQISGAAESAARISELRKRNEEISRELNTYSKELQESIDKNIAPLKDGDSPMPDKTRTRYVYQYKNGDVAVRLQSRNPIESETAPVSDVTLEFGDKKNPQKVTAIVDSSGRKEIKSEATLVDNLVGKIVTVAGEDGGVLKGMFTVKDGIVEKLREFGDKGKHRKSTVTLVLEGKDNQSIKMKVPVSRIYNIFSNEAYDTAFGRLDMQAYNLSPLNNGKFFLGSISEQKKLALEGEGMSVGELVANGFVVVPKEVFTGVKPLPGTKGVKINETDRGIQLSMRPEGTKKQGSIKSETVLFAGRALKSLGDKVKLVEEVSEIADAEVRQRLESMSPEELGNVEGFTTKDGTVYLMLNNLDSRRFSEVIAHEISHRGAIDGFKKIFGSNLNIAEQMIAAKYKDEISDIKKEYARLSNNKTVLTTKQAIGELLARRAENPPVNENVFKSLYSAAKAAITKHFGMPLQFTDGDINYLVSRTLKEGISPSGPSTPSDPDDKLFYFSLRDRLDKLGDRATYSSKPMTQTYAKVEAEMDKAYRLSRERNAFGRIMDTISMAVGTIHQFRSLDQKKDITMRETLRRASEIVSAVKNSTAMKLRGIYTGVGDKPLSDNADNLFNKLVVAEDMKRAFRMGLYEEPLKKGETLQFGIKSEAELDGLISELNTSAIRLGEKDNIAAAMNKRKSLMRDMAEDLVKTNNLNPAVMNDPDGFLHRISLIYNEALSDSLGLGVGESLGYVGKGLQRKRTGSTINFMTDVKTADFVYLAQARALKEWNKVMDTIRKEYDILDTKGIRVEANDKGMPFTEYFNKYLRDKAEYKDYTIVDLRKDVPSTTMLDGFLDHLDRFTNLVLTSNDLQAKKEAAVEARRMIEEANSTRYMIVPKRIADQLKSFMEIKRENILNKMARNTNTMFKKLHLYGPERVIKWQLSNIIGDVEASMVYPGLFKETSKAAKDLWNYHMSDKALSKELKAEIDSLLFSGTLSSGWVAKDIGDVSALNMFRNKADLSLTEIASLGADKYKALLIMRENIQRLAAYRYFKERLEKNPSEKLYGASKRELIDEYYKRGDRNEVAKILARDLIGDYGNISEMGQYLRSHLIPFYSFLEMNFKRYTNLIRNMPHEQNPDKSIAVAAGMGAKTLLGATGLYAAAQLWNKMMFPEEDKLLSKVTKGQQFIIVGKDEEGITAIPFQGALFDYLSWFNLDKPEEISKGFEDLMSGKKTLQQAMQDSAAVPVSKAASGIGPAKIGYEMVFRKQLFPDITKPRYIHDRTEYMARQMGIGGIYRNMLQSDVPARPGDLTNTFLPIKSVDTGEASYQSSISMVADFLENKGVERPDTTGTAKGEALRAYKTSLKYGDREKAQRNLAKFKELGGKESSVKASISKSDPLAFLPMKYRGEFFRSLSAEERQMFERGRDYWKTNLLQARSRMR